jgi:hypothetical protein
MLSKFFLTKWVDVCVLNQMKENIYQKSQKQNNRKPLSTSSKELTVLCFAYITAGQECRKQ